MEWIAPFENGTDSAALEKRLWDADDSFGPIPNWRPTQTQHRRSEFLGMAAPKSFVRYPEFITTRESELPAHGLPADSGLA
ncbi:MAG: hypothetical protein U5K76_03260 [Woeseiaceae bacterium]|nr:hypothetical protein [Woeseiaceae bacterium]